MGGPAAPPAGRTRPGPRTLALGLTGALLVRTSLGGTPTELEDILSAGLVATLGGAVAILAIATRSDGRPGFELSDTTPHRSSHGADAHPIEPT